MEKTDKNQMSSNVFNTLIALRPGTWLDKKDPSSVITAAKLFPDVSGPDKLKFFNQPLRLKEVSISEPSTPSIPEWWWGLQDEESVVPEFIDTGTQTDYRDSETQTDPWDTPYKVHRVFHDPELLEISDLRYDSGLPVSVQELEKIIRSRAKKLWECKLPPLSSDATGLKKRKQMIVEQMSEEWRCIVNDIEANIDARRKVKECCISGEAVKRKLRKNKIMEKICEIKKTELAENLTKIQDDLLKKLNQYDYQHAALHFATEKRSPECIQRLQYSPTEVAEYIELDQSSLNFKNKQVKESDIPFSQYYLSTAKGIVELELWLWEEQNICMESEIFIPKKGAQLTHLEKVLEQVQQDVLCTKDEKASIIPTEKSFQTERSKLRPPTPTARQVPQDTVDRNDSIILFQKILRGRALQKEVLEIKNKYSEIIKGLRTVYPLSKNENITIEYMREKMKKYYSESKLEEDKTCARSEVFSHFEGEIVSKMLVILGHSEERFHELDSVLKFIDTAKEKRRKREATEAGRRQHEILQRLLLDDICAEIYREKNKIM